MFEILEHLPCSLFMHFQVLELSWKCPGRRSPDSDKKTEETLTEEPQEEEKEEEKK